MAKILCYIKVLLLDLIRDVLRLEMIVNINFAIFCSCRTLFYTSSILYLLFIITNSYLIICNVGL